MKAEEPQENYGTGWIKLFRSVKNKAWFKKPDYLSVWIYMLLKANHKDGEWVYKGAKLNVKRGQFITSRKSISEDTGVQEMKVERILNYFKTEQQIEQQNLYTSRLITIVSYEIYQGGEQGFEQQVNSKRTASEQQVNTNKNNNNVKNGKKYIRAIEYPTVEQVSEFFKENGYKQEASITAFKYYADADWHDSNGKKVRSWKQKMRAVWFTDENKIKIKNSELFNRPIGTHDKEYGGN